MRHPDDHPDEGTIHAWLDGALSADEARVLEEHVAGCARCAEAVAEARGLIAAASGILAKLDVVPGGVVPRPAAAPPREAAAPTPVVPIDAARRATRRAPWWSSSALRVAAALVVVATGTLVVAREQGRSPRPTKSVVQFSVERSAEPAPTATTAAASVAEQAPAAPQAAAANLQSGRVGSVASPPTALSRTADGAQAVRPGATAPLTGRGAPSEVRTDLAAPPAPPSPAPAAPPEGAPVPAAVAAVGAGAASPERSAPTAQSLAGRDARAAEPTANVADARMESRKAAKMADEASTSPERRRAAVAAGAAVAAPPAIAPAPVPRAGYAARGAGCYELQSARWTPAEPRLVIPQRLVLDTMAEAPPGDASRENALAAHAIGPATATWRRAYWVPLAGDSLRVLWSDGATVVDLRARLVGDTLRGQAITFVDGARGITQRGTLTATRTSCPPP